MDSQAEGLSALERLLQVALRDTRQSRLVASCLLAWHNAEENGGWMSGTWMRRSRATCSVSSGCFGKFIATPRSRIQEGNRGRRAGLGKTVPGWRLPFDALEVTVHKPRATFRVRAGQLVTWLGRRGDGEAIGITTLKRRVQELLGVSGERTTGRRGERGWRR